MGKKEHRRKKINHEYHCVHTDLQMIKTFTQILSDFAIS